MPKPGPVVCAEAWSRSEARPPVACRSPARSCAPNPWCRSRSEARRAPVTARPGPKRPSPARPGPARPGPARPGPARPGPARPGPAARRGAVRSGPAGPSAARPGPARPGPARPCRPPGSAGGGRETGKTDSTTVEITCACRRMTGRVVLPTYGNKSRKTTKSDPSTGDQF